ncbi:MAG: HpcH/HpaI aldolase/citrate lyase family protein [Spirochaetaceae bacterium]|nr:HpcH/HpaI aldolase/citrate lyase family protein [Spirochaetaceae bacterium]
MIASLRRTMLFVPGNNPALVKDPDVYGPDSIIFDLEDSVAPTEKDAARLLVYSALSSVDYGGTERVVRINGLDTPWFREDVRAMVRAGIEVVRLPKTESAEDIRSIERLVEAEEKAAGRAPGSVRLMAALESPLAVINAYEIATASKRLVAIALSAEDFVTSMKTSRSSEGVELFEARGRIVIAARAAGVMAIDTVYSDVADEEGFLREVRLVKQMGFDGKSVINPAQIPVVHAAYAPTAEELRRARRVVAAAADAEAKGLGVLALDGKMIDKPIVERARRVVDLARASGMKFEEETR